MEKTKGKGRPKSRENEKAKEKGGSEKDKGERHRGRQREIPKKTKKNLKENGKKVYFAKNISIVTIRGKE